MHTPDGGVEVTQGLAAGELLVVQGFEALSEGAPVKISARTTLAAAERAASGGDARAPRTRRLRVGSRGLRTRGRLRARRRVRACAGRKAAAVRAGPP